MKLRSRLLAAGETAAIVRAMTPFSCEITPAAARKLALQALKDRKKRRRAHDDAKPQETKRAALRAVDANGCLDLVLDDAEPKLPPPPPPPSPTKRNAVLSPMARRLDEAIVSACRVPYPPGALEV